MSTIKGTLSGSAMHTRNTRIVSLIYGITMNRISRIRYW